MGCEAPGLGGEDNKTLRAWQAGVGPQDLALAAQLQRVASTVVWDDDCGPGVLLQVACSTWSAAGLHTQGVQT